MALAASVGALAALGGLRLRGWSGLHVSSVREEPSAESLRYSIAEPLLAGLALGLAGLLTLRFAVLPWAPAVASRMIAAAVLPLGHRLLLSAIAAVGEEVLFRLVMLSAAYVALVRLGRCEPGPPTAWIANVVCATLFAAAHLPAWSRIAQVNAAVLVPVVALDGVGGLLFGAVFLRRGLTAAICAHFGANLITQVVAPQLRW